MTSLLCIVKSDPITTLKLFMLKNRLGRLTVLGSSCGAGRKLVTLMWLQWSKNGWRKEWQTTSLMVLASPCIIAFLKSDWASPDTWNFSMGLTILFTVTASGV